MKSVNKKYLRSFLILAVFFALFGVISQVSAIAPYIPLVKLPGIDQAEANNLPAYLKAMSNLQTGAPGRSPLLLFLLAVFGKFQPIPCSGKKKARKK